MSGRGAGFRAAASSAPLGGCRRRSRRSCARSARGSRRSRRREIYAPLQPKEPYAWLSVTRDVAYGRAERNVLDVFTSPPRRPRIAANRWSCSCTAAGSRAARSARGRHAVLRQHRALGRGHGIVGVTINYRLAPQSTVAVGHRGSDRGRRVAPGERRAVRRRSEQDFPLGPLRRRRARRRLLADAATKGRDAGVAGAILTSGFYDLGKEVSVWKVYYGDDVSTYPERSSLPGLLKTTTPLLVTDAELDPRHVPRRNAEARAAARERSASRCSACT